MLKNDKVIFTFYFIINTYEKRQKVNLKKIFK